jgi:acylphosphatase/septal ring factor EnvC (AmiA/AmiB activator)
VELKAYNVKVYGRVQRVGFRRYALDNAQALSLQGYIKNELDGSVSIFVQGEENKIEKFIEAITKAPLPIVVTKIEKEPASYDASIKYFTIKYGDLAEELQEGFGSMQSIFMDYWQEFRDYRQEFRDFRKEFTDFRNEFRDFRQEFRDFRQEFRDFRNEFRDFVNKTDNNFKQVISLQEETLNEIKGMKNDIKDLRKDIKIEFRRLRRDIRALLNERLRKIEEDIAMIKAKLGL